MKKNYIMLIQEDGTRNMFPYFKLSFDNKDDLKQFTWRCKKI